MASPEPLPEVGKPAAARTPTDVTPIDNTLKKAEEELQSLKKTIAALDNLEARWKVR